MELPRPTAILLAAGLGLACHKSRVDSGEGAPAPWDPPTDAFGFAPVPVEACAPDIDEKISRETTKTIEVIALPDRYPHDLAADLSSVYFAELGDHTGRIYRATREDSRQPWSVERLASGEAEPGELVTHDHHVYWVVSEQSSFDPRRSLLPGRDRVRGPAAVRFIASSGGAVATLANEPVRPGRLVAQGDSLLWTVAPNHVREAHLDPNGGGGTPRELFTTTVMPELLAADDHAIYVFSGDRSLLRIARDGSRATVLVPTTSTKPIDLAVDGPWVYWLEEGAASDQPCSRNPNCQTHRPLAYPSGALRRVRAAGGPVEVVARDLPDVEKLVFHHNTAWITSRHGPLRVPTGPHLGTFVSYQPIPVGNARPAQIGDALVLAESSTQPRVVLLSSP